MSTTVHNTNAACCTIPPIQHDYTPKGTFKSLGDFKKVYVTGPDTTTDKAIVCVFDIFGFFPQTQQGADVIAHVTKAKVYMPDLFEPDSAFPPEKYPPQTDEDKAAVQAFFGGPASPPATTKKVLSFGEVLREGGVSSLGLYGYCWGGKVCFAAAGEGTPYNAVSIIHPAMLSVDDAEKLTIPLGIYISKDEPVEEYEKIVQAISKKAFASKNDNKLYPNMFHGFAAARGDLRNEENKKEYEDVTKRIAEFFTKNL